MSINIEVGITGSFQEPAFCDVDGLDGVCIADVDFIGRHAHKGAILCMQTVDYAGFVANVGMVV